MGLLGRLGPRLNLLHGSGMHAYFTPKTKSDNWHGLWGQSTEGATSQEAL